MEGTLRIADDVVAAIARDERLANCTVRRQDPGWLELEVSGLSRGRGAGPVLLVLAWPEVWSDAARLAPHLVRARSGNYGLLLVGEDADFVGKRVDSHAHDTDVGVLAVPISPTRFALGLRVRADACAMRLAAAVMELDLERARRENEMLITVGRALSETRDLKTLLDLVLRRAREVTGADAGSVYVVENQDAEVTDRKIKFTVSQNDSRLVETPEFEMPVSSSSIVGACVLSGQPITIRDLYALDPPGPDGNNPLGFVQDRSFDDRYRYETRSMLTVPMISARKQVIGVIQLINKRAKGYPVLDQPSDFDAGVIPFDETSVNYATSLASQAGIALENAMLYKEVTTLFNGFVKASVTAIESRDPTTSGHSERVATLTVGLAKAVDRLDAGVFKDLRFTLDELTTIEYAALLHDFGKVGVREHVLVKAKKLYEHQRELILERFRYIRRGLELDSANRKVKYLMESSRDKLHEALGGVESEAAARIAELDGFIQFVLAANEPTVLEQGGFERVADIAARTYLGDDGTVKPYLTQDECAALQILRGSLTESERDEINSHVVHTYDFLREIPWGRQFRGVPEIAHAHHEKLDGSGYPKRLKGDQIPAPARMMTISDIYDALTASDRPYKKAMPKEKALDILSFEVKKGMLDPELYRIFVEAQVWALVTAR
jgi:HD-GYP domain-containing protein (c-di-GMP phosphodiesterase class II)